jgi:hypothetical protein
MEKINKWANFKEKRAKIIDKYIALKKKHLMIKNQIVQVIAYSMLTKIKQNIK